MTVGDKRVVTPVGEEGGLVTDETGATHDEPFLVVDRFCDVGFTVVGVTDRDPVSFVDGFDGPCHDRVLGHGDRELDVFGFEGRDGPPGEEPRIGP